MIVAVNKVKLKMFYSVAITTATIQDNVDFSNFNELCNMYNCLGL